MNGAFPTGTVIAGYVIESVIGSGGMGTVYRVRGPDGRPLALKVVNRAEGIADEEFDGRVAREANVARVVRHPGLVKVHQHGAIDAQRSFLVMDLLQGRDLDTCLADQSFTLLECVVLLRQAIETLEAAHSVTSIDGVPRPIVHRDLKPSNLFVLEPPVDGVRIKIVDFGLVRQHGAKTLTRAGAGFGTICYMAPEQFSGARSATPATDVWAVGVMLYEVVAGFRPFITEDMASTLSAISRGHPPRLDTLVADCPSRYAAMVDACLEPERERRPTSAGVVLRELDAILGDPAFVAFASTRLAADSEHRKDGGGSSRSAAAFAETQISDAPSVVHGGPSAGAHGASVEMGRSPPLVSPSGVAALGATAIKSSSRIGIAVAASVGAGLLAFGAWLYVGARSEPTAPPIGASAAASAPPALQAAITQATVSVPSAFGASGLEVRLDGQVVGSLVGTPPAARTWSGRLLPGDHAWSLERAGDVLARATLHAEGPVTSVTLESPCPEGMVYVSAGSVFLESAKAGADRATGMVDHAFCVDRRETSFERVLAWCSAPDAADAADRAMACDGIDRCMASADPGWERGATAGTDLWPIPCIAAEAAMKFCADHAPSGRLPTTEEWLRAASGGHAGDFPWRAAGAPTQDEIAARAVVYPGTGSAYRDFDRFGAARAEGASPFGAYDLVGGLAEWTCESSDAGRCSQATLRGGSFLLSAGELLAAGGLYLMERAAGADDHVGVRCVADVALPRP